MKPEIALSRGATIAATGLLIVLLGLPLAPHATDAQRQDAPAGEWRYIGGDVAHTRLLAPRSDRRHELLETRGGLDLAGRQLRPCRGRPLPVNAALRGRPALHRRRRAACGRGHRSRHRRNHLDLPRATHDALRARHAQQLRQGRRLRRGRRAEGDLLHLAGVLPACARREVGAAPGRLGHDGGAAGLPALRSRRHAARTGQGLGALAHVRLQGTIPTTASLGISATCPPRRHPSSSTA